MSQKPEATSPESEGLPSNQAATRRSTKVDPLARRRLLLSGLGKGAAVVGVAVPLQTLAASALVCNGSSGKNGLCTVSGFQSAMHSFGAGSSQVQAKGRNRSLWAQGTVPYGAPAGTPPQPANAWPVPYTTLFKTIFGGTSTLTLFQVVQSDTPAAHWVVAYLNGVKYYPTTFPYPGVTAGGVTGVKDWYSHPQSAQALALFTQLETWI